MSAESNRMAIKRGFSKFRKGAEEVIRGGMINIAEAGMLFLVDAHEMFNISDEHNHINEDDTLAWAVSHDGIIVASGNYMGGGDDLPGSARQEAINLLHGTTGWVAIIYSDMQGWYRADWEEDYLNYSRENISASFNDIFKRVQ